MTAAQLIAVLSAADPEAQIRVTTGDADVLAVTAAAVWGQDDLDYTAAAGRPGDVFLSAAPSVVTPLRLFFYGTLMSGGFRDAERWGLRRVGEAKIRGDLYSVHGSFPAYVHGDGEVVGEVWEARSDAALRIALRTTDQIEGYHAATHTGMYLRETVDLLPGEIDGPVQVYRWNRDLRGLERIPSGSWRVLEASLDRRREVYGDEDDEPTDDTWADAVWGNPAA